MNAHPRGTRVGRFIDKVVSFVAGEWILTWSPYTANGGTVVATRTLWLTAWIYIPVFLLYSSLGEGRVAVLDIRQGGADVVETLPWLGAILAGIYAGFYTRFSSQWAYLASLYNQIIQTEISVPSEEDELREARLAAWKAGFIEDAEDLHLATKPLFVMAVLSWAKEDAVASAYGQNTIGGPERLRRLIVRLEQIAEPHAPARSPELLTTPLVETQEVSGHA